MKSLNCQHASFLLYDRRDYDRGLAALGVERAAGYFAFEIDGSDQHGKNKRGTARADSVLQCWTGEGAASSKDEQAINLRT